MEQIYEIKPNVEENFKKEEKLKEEIKRSKIGKSR